jgi:hypothetical protein
VLNIKLCSRYDFSSFLFSLLFIFLIGVYNWSYWFCLLQFPTDFIMHEYYTYYKFMKHNRVSSSKIHVNVIFQSTDEYYR